MAHVTVGMTLQYDDGWFVVVAVCRGAGQARTSCKGKPHHYWRVWKGQWVVVRPMDDAPAERELPHD